MKVLITGASGLLGRAVLKEFIQRGHQVKGTAFTRSTETLIKLDLNDSQSVENLISSYLPSFVIHCAAERRPDKCEQSPESTRQLNVESTRHLAELSSRYGFTLCYISTDYVFPGNPPTERGYEVGDETEPTNLYGVTKRDGENVVLKEREEKGAKATVLRVPVLYGPSESNSESAINILIDVVRQASRREKRITMDDWATRYPTHVGDIARVLTDLADLSQSKPLPPIVHFSSQTLFTKYTISKLFASLHEPRLELDEFEGGWFVGDKEGPKEGDTVRPRDCHLSNAGLESLGIDTTATDFESWWKETIQSGKV